MHALSEHLYMEGVDQLSPAYHPGATPAPLHGGRAVGGTADVSSAPRLSLVGWAELISMQSVEGGRLERASPGGGAAQREGSAAREQRPKRLVALGDRLSSVGWAQLISMQSGGH